MHSIILIAWRIFEIFVRVSVFPSSILMSLTYLQCGVFQVLSRMRGFACMKWPVALQLPAKCNISRVCRTI